MQRQYNGIPHPAQDNKWDKNTKLKQGRHQDNKIHAESQRTAFSQQMQMDTWIS